VLFALEETQFNFAEPPTQKKKTNPLYSTYGKSPRFRPYSFVLPMASFACRKICKIDMNDKSEQKRILPHRLTGLQSIGLRAGVI